MVYSNFAYLYIYTATGMENGGVAFPSIYLARRGPLVKVLITLEPHCIF